MRYYWLLFATLISSQAFAQDFLSRLDKDMPGPRTQVLVLGSIHLSGLPKEFNPTALGPVLDRLAAFKPDVITIEALSGESCDLFDRHPAIYAEVKKTFCADTDIARKATGLDVPQAIAEMNTLLKAWPAQPTPTQRKRLAAVLLAANERASALTQWLQLADGERQASPELPSTLVEALNKLQVAQNENYLIAARLAARLGHARVFAVDDHTGDNTAISDEAAYEKAILAAWASGHSLSKPVRQQEALLAAGTDLLPLFRYMNLAAAQQVYSSADMGSALKDKSPQQFGRLYVAGWDTRNMRMAANIQASFRERPGARVLSIVGATHKAWLDRLLALTQGVEIVDVQAVLK